jgi:hypothetical protein
MTYSPEVMILIAGILALIQSAVTITGSRAAERQGIFPNLPFSKVSHRLFNLPTLFIPIFFGAISVAYPTAIVTTSLGASLCVGMAVYFALKGLAYALSPEIRAAGPYIGTYLAFASAGCYLVGAFTGDVI